MVISEEAQRRINNTEEDIRALKEAIYGDREYIGLSTRIKIIEERLAIFWWALAVVGATVIALAVRQFFKSFGA